MIPDLVVVMVVSWMDVGWREGEDREIKMKIEKKIINKGIMFNFDVKIRVLMWSELWNGKLK